VIKYLGSRKISIKALRSIKNLSGLGSVDVTKIAWISSLWHLVLAGIENTGLELEANG
jgi:hypothetical protein